MENHAEPENKGISTGTLLVCAYSDVGFAGIAMRPAFAGMPKE